MSETIRVVSLNCWGLKYISKARKERLQQIGVELAAADPPPDIVGLQECWVLEDYHAIREQTKHILPYGKFYFSGVFGGGLAILSKWPIGESSMIPYKLNGRPTAFFRGDWFVGKGVACARIRSSAGQRIEVFCTHLHAPYEEEPNDSYLCHRTAQAWEISKLVRYSQEAGNLVIALGDFNMLPLSLAHQLITLHGNVQDTWRLKHPSSSVGAAKDEVEKLRGQPVPSGRYNLDFNGVTCDSTLNTWRWNKGQQQSLRRGKDIDFNPEEPDHHGKRLDYIFVGDPSGVWRVENQSVGMRQTHPILKCSLSDHFSVEITLSKGNGRISDSHSSTEGENRIQPNYLAIDKYDAILTMIEEYIAREQRQRRWRLRHFMASWFVVIACLIGVWWSPHNYVAFILVLVSTCALTVGTIDGLIGGLFMSAELRSLREFSWETKSTVQSAQSKFSENTVNTVK